MSKKERRNLDLVTEKYGPFEKWHGWACVIAILCYFVIPEIADYFIGASPSLILIIQSVNYSWVMLLFLFIQFGLTFAVVISCFGKYIWQSFKLFFSKFFRNIGISITLFFASTICLQLVYPIIMYFNQNNANQNQESLDATAAVLPVVMWIVTVIMAPICEEIIFRWGIFRPLYKKCPWFAHIFTAIIFSGMHIITSVLSGNYYELVNILAYLPLAFAMSFAYSWSGNIFTPILLHIVNNAIASA